MPKYKIVWDPEAELQLIDIWLYIANNSVKYADEFVGSIDMSINRLITDPFLGQKEDLLKKAIIEHRYLVNSHYKITHLTQGIYKNTN